MRCYTTLDMPTRMAILTLLIAAALSADTRPAVEPNRGQFSEAVLFGSRNGPVQTAVTADGLLFARRADTLRVRFGHAGPLACRPDSPLEGKSNYLDGQPAVRDVPRYRAVSCANLYDGIGWRVYDNGRAFEQDWTVVRGADLSAIQFAVENSNAVRAIAAYRYKFGTGIPQQRPKRHHYLRLR
jgi:hypothetical protein